MTLGCDADEETLNTLATGEEAATEAGEEAATEAGEEAATEAGEEAATEAGEEAATEAGPCDFAMTDGEDPALLWTAATLGEDSSEFCPPGEGFLEGMNAPDDGEEEEEDESDCDPVEDETAEICTLLISCDGVEGSFSVETDGSVEANFTVTVPGPDAEGGGEDVVCEYTLLGTVTLP